MILNIADRNIRVDNADNQISYNSDYIAEFHFDDEWNGKIKTARFVQNCEYFDVVLVDDRCEIPPLKTGFVRIGVFSDSMTSTYVDVYFKTSIKDGTGNPTEPPKDVYAQLTALIESGILKGADGLTPYVGENGNWWIGDVDTGVLARGYTPQKGVDYFTEDEIQQIQNEISEGAIGEFKAVVDSETATFNINAENTLTGYNTNAQEKFETYNANADSKFEAYNTNAEAKLSEYNSNAESKVSTYNQNDVAKTEAYNKNAQDKLNSYNSNTQTKLDAYNENADNRIAEFNAQTEQIQTDISGLKTDVSANQSELAKTNLYLDALYKLNKGQTYDVLEQESEAYSVDVSSGAKYVGIDKVGGKSVVWNQLWDYENASAEAGVTYTYENHFYDVVKNTTANNGMYVRYNFKPNDKYYVSYEASSNDNIKLVLSLRAYLEVELTESNKRYRSIITTNTSRALIYLYSNSGVACTYRVGNIKVINLTRMFGAGNEPSTVEEFEAMFPDDYYPYSEPTIISSQNDRIEVVSADGTITQQITTGFPVLNSAGSVYDYIDLNEGKLHQRVGVVDLGTLDWVQGGSNNKTSWVPVSWRTNVKPAQNTKAKANILCSKYYTDSAEHVEKQVNDKTIAVNKGGWVYIYDSAYVSATPQAFKEAMSGVMLYYELAEEIITDIEIPTELTDWLTVEAGGSITFHNADEGKRLLIPNKLSFVRKLDEVTV